MPKEKGPANGRAFFTANHTCRRNRSLRQAREADYQVAFRDTPENEV